MQQLKKQKRDLDYAVKLFILSFISMLVVMLSVIIRNNGVFFFAGDYCYQQIPFYSHASDIIHNLDIGWDWYTDLGNDFITSYSYYFIGSIFFWMISWLSSDLIIYAMPVMIAFKTAVASLGAYFYIKRYVKNNDTAFIGAFMYAFSGFQMASLVFNSFHDVTALFPFLLLSFELLVTEKKKGFFAIMTGLMALTNYFFFFGIVVFVVIYYIIKCITKDFSFTLKGFGSIVLESCLGVGSAAVILVPTFLLLSSADRIGNTLYGVDLISYSDNTIIPKIIQSFFIAPDPMSSGMLFKSENNANNWASISFYLPFFSITGVIAYLKNKRSDWLSVIIITSFIISLIPVLNSLFSLFNVAYYARWFFMPVLLMCLATSKSLEEKYDLYSGIKICASGLLILIFISFLPDKCIINSENNINHIFDSEYEPETEIKMFAMDHIPVVFWQCIGFGIVFLLLIFIYNHENDKRDGLIKKINAAAVVLTIVIYSNYIDNCISSTEFNEKRSYALSLGYNLQLNDEESFRITHLSDMDKLCISNNNFSMLWRCMNVGCFHSVEMNESDDFYYNVQGRKRFMKSSYSADDYPVYGLLSLKYILNASTGDDLNVEIKRADGLKGCTLFDKQGCYYIYKNEHFVPFGFMYDYCIGDDALEKYLDENVESETKFQYKKLAMMRALVLDDEDIEKYKNYISVLPEDMLAGLDENSYYSDCDERKKESCSNFDYNSKGYCAEITVDRKGLVYFSVPCSAGWSAKVNGKDTDIIKAHYGLTAIAVEPGENRIECFYRTPGLAEGKLISLVSVFILIGYLGLNNFAGKGGKRKNDDLEKN